MAFDPEFSNLQTPHVSLGVELLTGVAILRSTGYAVSEEVGDEHLYRVKASRFSIAIYEKTGLVRSVWYDDPTGRAPASGREKKVELYLVRYGALSNWKLRMDNGWMHYWFNPKDGVSMVYGIHKDVIRFNRYSEADV